MSMEADWPDMLLAAACYGVYAGSAAVFLKRHLKGTWAQGAIFGAGLFCGLMAAAFLTAKGNTSYIMGALCSHAGVTVLVMAAFKGEKEKKLLAAVILIAMNCLVWNFSESFLCCVWLIGKRMASGGSQEPFVGVWGERVITVLTYMGGITTIRLLSKSFEPVFGDKTKSWYLFMSAPLFAVTLVTDLVNWAASNGIMVQDWQKYGLYENQLFSHGAMCIFTGLAMAASGCFVFGMDRIDREERAGEQYRSQVMYYQMMEEEYSRMERLRHDMKNHVIALNHLVQNRQWEQAVSYLGAMAEAGGVENGDEITGSLAVDALLYYKKQQAGRQNIRWQCDARLPKDCAVKEIDLCIMVGNALDNALEACGELGEEESPFIQVYLGTVKKCLLLEVRNSMSLSDKPKKKREKEEFRGHGLGLGNIKEAADHYNGVVGTEREKGVFTLSVLLPLAQP